MKVHNPPRWADRLLTWYCAPELLEDLQGDLHQRFYEHLRDQGAGAAKRRFILDVFSFIRPYVIRRRKKQFKSNAMMLGHYLKTSIRNVRRDTRYLLVNTLGLALGIGCALLLAAYVYTELSFDTGNRYADRTYRLSWNTIIDSQETEFAPTAPAIGVALQAVVPEFEKIARVMTWSGDGSPSTVSYNGDLFSVPWIMNADSSIFNVMDYTFIAGDRTALKARDRIVLTHSLAEKIFGPAYAGKQDLIHTVIKVDDKELAVAGVIHDIPYANHFRPQALIGWEGYGNDGVWNDSHAFTYVRLVPGADQGDVQKKIDAFTETNETLKKLQEEYGARVKIYIDPLKSIHMDSHKSYEMLPPGNPQYLYAFAVIAVFFLLMSGINYINLAIAASWHRYKEIGVRKVMGALRGQVQRQFLTEASVMIVVAFVAGLFVLYLLIPLFNSVMNYQLQFTELLTPRFVAVVIVTLLLMVLLSGYYPSFYLSRANPIMVFKNKLHIGNQKAAFRKMLLVAQFTISAIMILAIIIVTAQVDYLSRQSLGFNKDNVLVIKVPWAALNSVPSLKEELMRINGVTSAASAEYLPGVKTSIDEHKVERANGEMVSSTVGRVFFDKDYLALMGLEIVEGRNYDGNSLSDYKTAFLVNEAAVRAYGWREGGASPIGRQIEAMNYGKKGTVIGVLKDANLYSLHNKVEPLIFNIAPNLPYVYVRLRGDDLPETMAAIERTYSKMIQNFPYDYQFLDTKFDMLYDSDRRMNKAFMAGGAVLTLISCMGLFALSAFLVVRRTKEVGVRKVLGASVKEIVLLLSKEYIMLIVGANVLAITASYFLARQWLSGYAYKVTIAWWFMLAPLAITLVLAFLSLSFQVIRASMANPVKSLKYE